MNILTIKNLFFENISIRQTIFKNTFWLTIAEIVSRLLKLALIVLIVRVLGATEYGKFAFALSYVGIFVLFADLGISAITTREFSRETEREKDYPAILFLKILLSIGAFILMIVGSFFITSDPIIQKIIWILGLFIIITSFFTILYAFLRARQKMEYEALIKILQTALMVGIGVFVILKSPFIESLSYGYLIANLMALTIVLLIFHFRIQPIRLSYNPDIWKKFLSISWPLSIGFIIGWIYVSIDSIMLGYFNLITENGWYMAAHKITAAIVISAALISKSFFPPLSKFFKESTEKLQQVWNYQMELMIFLALPIMTGGILLADKIINLFYGSGYDPSILAFQILILVSVIDFFYYPYIIGLIVSDQEKKNFLLIIIGAVINIILNIILIPVYGFIGAGIATIISSFIILLLAIEFSRRFTSISPFNFKLFKGFISAFAASLIMLLLIKQLLIYDIHLLFLITTGGIVYLIFFLASRKFLKNFSFIKN